MDKWIICATANKGYNIATDPGGELSTSTVLGLVVAEAPSDISASCSIAIQDTKCASSGPKRQRRVLEKASSTSRCFTED